MHLLGTPYQRVPIRFPALLLILAAGALLRGAYLVELQEQPEFQIPQEDQVDMAFFDNYGMDLASRARSALNLPAIRQRYPRPVAWTQRTDEPFVRPPGYSFFLAALYFVFGDNQIAVRVVQMLMGLGSAWMIYRLGMRLCGAPCALLAALGMTFYWPLIIYESVIHAQTLMIFIMLIFVHTALRWMDSPSIKRAGVMGIAAGVSTWIAPAFVVFLPVFWGWMLWVGATCHSGKIPLRKTLISSLALTMVYFIPILPLTFQNYRSTGDFTLISTGSGLMLLIGNHPGADGYYRTPEAVFGPYVGDHDAHMRHLEEKWGQRATWEKMGNIARAEALRHIRENPWDFIRLTLKRAVLFWTPKEIAHNVTEYCNYRFSRVLSILPGDFKYILALAVVGLIQWLLLVFRRSRTRDEGLRALGMTQEGFGLLLLIVLVWYAPYTVFYVAAHYRIPLLPYLIMFAAFGVHKTFTQLRARDPHAFLSVLPGLTVFIVSLCVPVSYEKDAERWMYFRLRHFEATGQRQKAISVLERVLEVKPDNFYALTNLGDLKRTQGTLDEARTLYEYACRAARTPDEVISAGERLGGLLMEQGDADAAYQVYLRVLQHAPSNFIALHGAGNIALSRNRLDEATDFLTRAASINPDNANTWFLLGLVHEKAGNLEGALQAFESSVERNPEDIWALLGVARRLADTDPEASKNICRQVLRIDSENMEALRLIERLVAAEGGSPPD